MVVGAVGGRPRRADRPTARGVLLVGTALFALAWALAYLSFPFGRDQGIFAWVGEVVLRGGLPFRDAWDVKGPAAHLLFALSHWIFGRTQWGIRLLDLVSLAATAGLIGHIAGKLGCREYRWLAPAAFLLWYASLGYWNTAQPDGWATLLLAIAVALVLAEGDSFALPRLFLAGFAVGVAVLFKPFYGSFLLLLLAARGLDALRSGGGVEPSAGPKGGRWSALAAAVLAVVILGFAIKGPIEQVGRWSVRVAGLRSWDSYYEKFGHYRRSDYSYWASSQVARYLRAESEPEETVFIWGIETILHYLSERDPPTRFGFNHPFTVGPAHLTAKYRLELMKDLRDHEPGWIVLVDNDTQRIQSRTSMEHFSEFPELSAFVEEHYCRARVIEDFTLLRRCR